VQDAWDFADASAEPPIEALYEDVLVDTTSDGDANGEPGAAKESDAREAVATA